MKRFLFFLFLSMSLLVAQDLLAPAREALENGFPQIAVLKIEEAVPNIGKSQAGTAANVLYARALIESGQPQVADKLLKQELSRCGMEGLFWLAQIQAANGDWNGALKNYATCAGDSAFSLQKEAIIGQARMLKNTARVGEARMTFEKAYAWPSSPARVEALLDLAELELAQGKIAEARKAAIDADTKKGADTTRRMFLSARMAFLENDWALTIGLLNDLKPLNSQMALESVILRSKALSLSGGDAEMGLEEFIANNPDVEGLERAFAALDEIYVSEVNPSSSELKRWANEKDNTLRCKLAVYYLARFEARLKNTQAAAALLETLSTSPASNPLATETALDLAALRTSLGQSDAALALLAGIASSSRSEFLKGLALARKGDHAAAASAFFLASENSGLAEDALFNAAICQLLGGTKQNTALVQLEKKYSKSPRLAELKLQESFKLAREGAPEAADSLKKIAKSGDKAIAGPAALALAEWRFQQLDYKAAEQDLNQLPADVEPARKGALGVFLADTGNAQSDARTLDEARKFLAVHTGSAPEASVRMKLGEILFRKGDFAAARVELESLARKFVESEFHFPALFLAAQAAARIPSVDASGDAMLLFEEIAAKNNPFSHRARLEQSSILASQNRLQEASLVLDKILSSNPDARMKATALVEKGKNLFAQGNSDPSNYQAAIYVWKQVASEQAADPSWRNQAFTRMGTAYEKIGDLNAAVMNYYEVFKPTIHEVPEFFWFYKAGFSAGRILESQGKWNEAIRVYEIMSSTEGPRSIEAKNRIQKIRLEQFLWEGA